MQTLVLVHGYLGGSAQWEAQISAFSNSFQVIAPDLPGFGLNRSLSAPETIAQFASFVLEEVSARGVGRFHLLGHSMGGMIAQQMVAQAPGRIDKLVLYSTGAIGALPGRFETIAESKRRLVKEGVRATTRRTAATWFVEEEKSSNYVVCQALADGVSEQAALAGLSAMEHWSGEGCLGNVVVPTLVLWGDRDRTYTWQQTQKLWRHIPGASLAVIPGCAHAVHLEKPELFNTMVAEFLTGR